MYAGFNIKFKNSVELVNSSFSGVPKRCGVNFSTNPELGFVLNIEEIIFEFLRKALGVGHDFNVCSANCSAHALGGHILSPR